MAAMGFSFMPGADAAQGMRDMTVGGSGGASTPQQAVQIRSLRMPRTLPSNAPVNQSLLMGPGGAGSPGLTSLIQHLMQIFRPGAERPMAPMLGVLSGGRMDTSQPYDAPPFTFHQPTPTPRIVLADDPGGLPPDASQVGAQQPPAPPASRPFNLGFKGRPEELA